MWAPGCFPCSPCALSKPLAGPPSLNCGPNGGWTGRGPHVLRGDRVHRRQRPHPVQPCPPQACFSRPPCPHIPHQPQLTRCPRNPPGGGQRPIGAASVPVGQLGAAFPWKSALRPLRAQPCTPPTGLIHVRAHLRAGPRPPSALLQEGPSQQEWAPIWLQPWRGAPRIPSPTAPLVLPASGPSPAAWPRHAVIHAVADGLGSTGPSAPLPLRPQPRADYVWGMHEHPVSMCSATCRNPGPLW